MGKKAYTTIASEERGNTTVAKADVVSSSVDLDTIGEEWIRGEVQAPSYRDKKFAIAFMLHLAVIVFSAPFAPSIIKNNLANDYYGGRRTLQVKNTDHETRSSTSSFFEPRALPHRNEHVEYGGDIMEGGVSNFETTENYNDYKRLVATMATVTPSMPLLPTSTYEESEGDDDYYDDKAFFDLDGKFLYDDDKLEMNETSSGYDEYNLDDDDQSYVIPLVIAFVVSSIALSMVLTLGALYYLQHHAERVIKCSIFFTIAFFLCLGAWISTQNQDYYDDNTGTAVVLFIIAMLYVCYAVALWKKIPFAASTLSTGVTACKANLGVFGFAFLSPLLYFGTFAVQAMSFVTWFDLFGGFDEYGPNSDAASVGIVISSIFILLSIYWTAEVIKNISTVTVSGTVGTWWFSPVEASSFCSNAVLDSFKRAMTYSFGSICFGSLIVAILNVLVHFMRRLRRERGCVLLFCVIQCIINYLEMLAEYFNKWAFVYVGLYGYDYMTAGKNVMRLFKSRGWSSVISHSLVQKAMFMVAMCVALVTGLVVALVGGFFEEFMNPDMFGTVMFWMFFSGFYVSLVNSQTLLTVVSTASDTTIVCFAEGPAEFEENHPSLSAQMTETFSATFPEVNFGRGAGEVV